MATTVNNAFNEFMKDIVNLDPNKTSTARSSRDNLIALGKPREISCTIRFDSSSIERVAENNS